MPEIDISKLAALDELGAPPREDRSAPPLPSAFAPPSFAPPGEDDALGVERSTRAIRIENQWQRERQAKQAAAALPPPRPRRRIGGVLAAIAAIAAVIVAVVMIVRHQRPPAASRGGSNVSIRITAHEPTEVTIDGRRAGKTPLTLHQPRSTQPIQITTPHATRQVVPDRDQVVDLSR